MPRTRKSQTARSTNGQAAGYQDAALAEEEHVANNEVTAEVFADENLLEHILLQGGITAVLAAPPVCQAFNAACKLPSLWRRLGVPGLLPESTTSSAAVAGTSQSAAGTSQSVGLERELYRQRWESARWASGKVRPGPFVVHFHPPASCPAKPRPAKILSAACFSDLVCVGGKDDTIRCYSLAGSQLSTLQGHAESVSVRVLASCEQQQRRWLASAGGDGLIKLWDVDCGTALATSPTGCAPRTSQFDRARRVPTMEFFRASTQPAPSLLVDGNFIVDWRPDGTCVVTERHNLCACGATSTDEPSIAFGAYGRGVFRLDLREAPPNFEASHYQDYSFEGRRWTTNDARYNTDVVHTSDIQWLRADSQRIVGAAPDGVVVWDVRKPGEPIVRIAVANRGGRSDAFEASNYRQVKDIDLASRGRLVLTTFNTYSGNQGCVSLWDLSTLSNVSDDTWHPAAMKMRFPSPVQTRSILISRLIGRQTVVSLSPSHELFTWKVGSKRADHVPGDEPASSSPITPPP